MRGIGEAIAHESKMSRQEIIERFLKFFGREMTDEERRSFFLDLQLPKKTKDP